MKWWSCKQSQRLCREDAKGNLQLLSQLEFFNLGDDPSSLTPFILPSSLSVFFMGDPIS